MSVKGIHPQSHILIKLSPIKPETYMRRVEEYKRLMNLIDKSEFKVDQEVEMEKAQNDRRELESHTKRKLDII